VPIFARIRFAIVVGSCTIGVNVNWRVRVNILTGFYASRMAVPRM
jgi:hypothetical protein